MTASLVGTPSSVDASTQNSSASVTVPSGIARVVAFWVAWTSGGISLSSLTLDGNSFTIDESLAVSGDACAVAIATLDYSGNGSKTLAWTQSAAPTEGAPIVLLYLDEAGTVRASDSSAWTGTAAGSVTISSVAADFVAGLVGVYYAPPGSPNHADANATGQTVQVDDYSVNVRSIDVATVDSPGASTTTFQTGSDGYYGGVAAISIAEVAAGGANPKGPLGMPLHGPFGGPV